MGLGIASVSDPYELKMDGSPEVRRFFSIAVEELSKDTPAIRRQAPRTASVIFMIVFLYRTLSCGASSLARKLYP